MSLDRGAQAEATRRHETRRVRGGRARNAMIRHNHRHIRAIILTHEDIHLGEHRHTINPAGQRPIHDQRRAILDGGARGGLALVDRQGWVEMNRRERFSAPIPHRPTRRQKPEHRRTPGIHLGLALQCFRKRRDSRMAQTLPQTIPTPHEVARPHKRCLITIHSFHRHQA